MHDSLVPQVKFYIDSAQRTESHYFFEGWIFHESERLEQIILRSGDSSTAFNQFLERLDVHRFYPNLDNPLVGFKIEMEHSAAHGAYESFELLVKYKGETVKVADIKKPVDLSQVGKINSYSPSIIAVDNFYENPDEVREYALTLDFQINQQYHKGQRTKQRVWFDGTKEFLEDSLKKKVTSWENQPHNGVFQYCTAEDPLVYHTDTQSHAAVVFLTPDAPVECGTSFFKHKRNGLRKYPSTEDCIRFNKSSDELYHDMFKGNFYDKTPWELVDVVGNVYNRMAIWDAKLVHAATQYFGNDKTDSRLFHMFFFDAA